MYKVYACIGSVQLELIQFKKQEDAERFCEERNYCFKDENDFEWNMVIFAK